MAGKATQPTRDETKIVIRIPKAQRDQFKQKARAEGHTITFVIARAIDEYMAGTWHPVTKSKGRGKSKP